jgi:hypothetical protein
MLPTRNLLAQKRYTQTENDGKEEMFHANGNQKQAGAATLIR